MAMIPSIRHEIVGPSNARHRLRIAHLSDLHLWFSGRKLRHIERQIEAVKPDVLALTGDYADTPSGRRLAIDWMRKMAATYPLCWVAGNHDRWWGRRFLEELERLPRAWAIDRHDAWITGKLGCRYRFTSLARAVNPEFSEPRCVPTVVLLHDPHEIVPEKLQGMRDGMLLAGHLHGGQINLWRDGQGQPQPAASCYKWLADRSMVGSVPLIVSRGLGDTLPLRIGAPMEIVVVDFFTCPETHVVTTTHSRDASAPALL
ncbi:MAG: metallophosphoesterase [Verrucomicrobiota bacterium]